MKDKPYVAARHGAELNRKRLPKEADKKIVPPKLKKPNPKDVLPVKKVQESSSKSDVKPVKAVEVLEKVPDKKLDSDKKSQSGRYALNPLLTRSLEAELQDLMIKVWQVFPDEAESDAEAIVAEKFRNRAGDEFRNMLGLNATQRLLNVFNRLYVKLNFSKPPGQELFKAFVKKYNIKSFKELAPNGSIYVAEARDIATFDELCNGNQKASGDIKVTVHPCYRFNACPPNLECSFSMPVVESVGQSNISKTKNTTENKTSSSPKVNPVQQNKTAVKNTEKPTQASGQSSPKVKPVQQNKTAVKNTEKPTQASGQSSPKVKPVQQNKTAVKNTEKPTEASGQITQKTKAKEVPVKETVSTATKTNVTNKIVNKDKVEAAPVTKPVQKSVETTPVKVTKEKVVTKPDPPVTNKAKVEQPAKTQNKSASETNMVKKDNVNVKPAPITKTVSNVTPTKKPSEAKPVMKTPTKSDVKVKAAKTNKIDDKIDDGDDEELNDEDILKLLCGGVVLDECSGSDEE